jgi:hypothetical protein
MLFRLAFGMFFTALLLAAAQPQPLAGFYRSNQMEIGAALQLDPDGKFQYQLDYGAVSEAAEGEWSSDGTSVYLTSKRMIGAYKEPEFVKQPLAIDGGRLMLRRYDTVIRFELEELPVPADKK